MQSSAKRRAAARRSPQLLKYLGAVGLLTIAMMGLKAIAAWAADRFLYQLPILGGLLQSLELMEVSNVIVCALLGLGLGAATRWLPARWGLAPRAIALVVALPLVFLSSYAVRHHLWVQQVAAQAEVPLSQAERITDNLLQQQSGQTGMLGFFRYTATTPIPPTELVAPERADQEDKWFRSELTRYSGVEPGVFSRLFHWTGWGIRWFYMLLAGVTGIIYFAKGLVWADNQRSPAR